MVVLLLLFLWIAVVVGRRLYVDCFFSGRANGPNVDVVGRVLKQSKERDETAVSFQILASLVVPKH